MTVFYLFYYVHNISISQKWFNVKDLFLFINSAIHSYELNMVKKFDGLYAPDPRPHGSWPLAAMMGLRVGSGAPVG